MEALFVVPTLISESVNNRLVPAISKLIERNILLTNAATFRSALLRKYSSFRVTSFSESAATDTWKIGSSVANAGMVLGRDLATANTGSATAEEKMSDKKNLTDTASVELPTNITFFHNISVEPTYLSIPISVKSKLFVIKNKDESSTRTAMIGVKCVPYKLNDVNNVVPLMQELSSMTVVQAFFFRKWNSIKNRIPLTPRWHNFKGEKTGQLEPDIIFSPNSSDLDASGLASMMKSGLADKLSGNKSASWSTMVVLDTSDFTSVDLGNTLMSYKKMVRAGWGDMVIMNLPNDSIHFCLTKIGACYEMNINYLKQVLNLENVLDYSEISRFGRAFKVSTVGSALREDVDLSKNNGVMDDMYNIIRG